MERTRRLTLFTGSILLGLMVGIVALVTLLRFGFSFGHVWLLDLQKYLFSMLVSVSVLAAYLGNTHVRTGDPVAPRFPVFTVFEHLALVAIPMAILLFLTVPVLVLSWSRLEASGEFAGLPGYFLVKSLLFVSLVAIVFSALSKSFQARNAG